MIPLLSVSVEYRGQFRVRLVADAAVKCRQISAEDRISAAINARARTHVSCDGDSPTRFNRLTSTRVTVMCP